MRCYYEAVPSHGRSVQYVRMPSSGGPVSRVWDGEVQFRGVRSLPTQFGPVVRATRIHGFTILFCNLLSLGPGLHFYGGGRRFFVYSELTLTNQPFRFYSAERGADECARGHV